ncbi:hypothetical protein BC831DRAFT_444528 [Entophlyctis helioformis]|nr:hypothetical protein BC831DRAFT_444528 [Entophlyctis helioformis]
MRVRALDTCRSLPARLPQPLAATRQPPRDSSHETAAARLGTQPAATRQRDSARSPQPRASAHRRICCSVWPPLSACLAGWLLFAVC